MARLTIRPLTESHTKIVICIRRTTAPPFGFLFTLIQGKQNRYFHLSARTSTHGYRSMNRSLMNGAAIGERERLTIGFPGLRLRSGYAKRERGNAYGTHWRGPAAVSTGLRRLDVRPIPKLDRPGSLGSPGRASMPR